MNEHPASPDQPEDGDRPARAPGGSGWEPIPRREGDPPLSGWEPVPALEGNPRRSGWAPLAEAPPGGQRTSGWEPVPGSSRDPASPERRRFLTRVSLGLGGLVGLLAGLPLLGILFAPVARRQIQAWRGVGDVSDFRVGETVMVRYLDPEPLPWAGLAGMSAAWLRRETETDFVAFSMYCSHTGCPVTWSPGTHMFLCPCHGGSFHQDGRVAAGPPPRPLDRLPVRIRDGRVEVRTIGAPLTG